MSKITPAAKAEILSATATLIHAYVEAGFDKREAVETVLAKMISERPALFAKVVAAAGIEVPA